MDELVAVLVRFVSDPAVIATIVAAAAILIAQSRLYGKQHEFLRERLDVLRVENEEFRKRNEELRTQLRTFEEENQRLKSAAESLARLTKDLRETSEVSEARQREFTVALQEISYAQQDGLAQLATAIREGGVRPELLSLVDQLAAAVLAVENERAHRLRAIQERIRHLGPNAS